MDAVSAGPKVQASATAGCSTCPCGPRGLPWPFSRPFSGLEYIGPLIVRPAPVSLQQPSSSPSIPRQPSASARHAGSRRCHIAPHTRLNFHRPESSVSTRILFDTCGTSSCSAVNTTAVSRRLKSRPYIPPALLGPRFNRNTAVKDHFNFDSELQSW
jgi:hypothetical protein